MIMQKSKILFIHPPSDVKLKIHKGLKYPPMGIAFISAVVREQGHSVRIFDGNVEKYPFEKLRQILAEFRPDVVGIGFTSLLAHSAYNTAEFVKKNVSQPVTVLAGGYHPTVMCDEVIKDKNFDYVFVGEAEQTILEWLQMFEAGKDEFKKIKGLVFRKGNEIIHTERRELIADLDNLTIPAYDLLLVNHYSSMISTRKPYVTFIRSRGCPFKCTFCGVQSMFGHKYRCQSPEKTVSEIDTLVNQFNVKEILFKDSEFLIDRKNVAEFCKLMIAKKYDLIWSCNARVDMVDEEILTLMKKAGCKMVTYGVESGNQEILYRLKKNFKINKAREAIKMTKKVGMKCIANFMFGNPGETRTNVEETIKFMREVNPDFINCAYLTAFPGSKLYEQALSENWFIDGKPVSYGYEDLKLNATEMSLEELSQVLKYAIKKFYFRPRYILKRMMNLNSAEIKNNIKGFWAIITS